MNYEEYRFEVLPSTQDFLREKRCGGKNALAVAKAQSGGKGTKGRSFECNDGGLWLSYLSFDERISACDAFLMVVRSAVAVCKTLEEYGLSPKIKWANDVLLGGKKVCGVLTESVLSGQTISSVLFGIGLNVNNVLSAELSKIATTMSAFTGKKYDLNEVERRLLAHFFAPFSFDEYRARLAYLGEKVTFVYGEQIFSATVAGVTERGELLLTRGGKTSAYAYGEISFYKGQI